jgi:hypothetical protein
VLAERINLPLGGSGIHLTQLAYHLAVDEVSDMSASMRSWLTPHRRALSPSLHHLRVSVRARIPYFGPQLDRFSPKDFGHRRTQAFAAGELVGMAAFINDWVNSVLNTSPPPRPKGERAVAVLAPPSE